RLSKGSFIAPRLYPCYHSARVLNIQYVRRRSYSIRETKMIPRAAWYLVTKAERAKLHLDAFNRHVSAYMKEPYTVVRKHEAHNRRHVKRYERKPFQPVMGMELGEFLYC